MTPSWRRLSLLLSGSRRLVLLTAVAVAVQAAVFLPIPLLVRDVFAYDIPHRDEDAIALKGVALFALYTVGTVVAVGTAVIAGRIVKRAVIRLRTELVERLYELPKVWHDRQEAGMLHAHLVQDTEAVQQMLLALIAQAIPGVLVSVLLAVVGLTINPPLFGVLSAVLLFMLLSGHWLARHLRSRAVSWRAAIASFSAETNLLVRAITLAKASGAEAIEQARSRDRFDRVGEASRRVAISGSAYGAVQASIVAIAGAAVLVAGGVAAARGSLTVAQLLSFYAIVALIVRQLSSVAQAVPNVLAGWVSLRRLEAILAADEAEPYRGAAPIEFRGAIRLDGVSFSYGDDPEVLHHVDVAVASGDRLVVTGPNGAGKSTLVALMLGLYHPSRGRVLADGIPLAELDLRALRRQIGLLTQDPLLFPGTIRENIAYAWPDADDEAILNAATRAGAATFVDALPHRYETVIGDDGTRLSGGQRQRIALARALIAEPPLLILDEPTTYLDDAAIAALMTSLATLAWSPSIVVITHDTSVAAHAERVVHLRAGRVLAEQPPGAAVPPAG